MATRLVPTLYQVLTDEGEPGNGYLLYFYTTGTTTPKDTYSDEALTVANTNPVVADSAGRFVDIWGEDKNDYKVILKTDADVTIDTQDPVDDVSPSINAFSPRPYQHWGTTTNTADAYRIKPDPSITAYTADIRFSMLAHLDNNAGCSLAVFQEGTVSTYLANLTMKKFDSSGALVSLVASDMEANQLYDIFINSTNAILLNPNKPYITNLTINEKLNTQSGISTIATGAFAYTYNNTQLKGQGDVADTLTDISGGGGGDRITIRSENTYAITITHNAAKIDLYTGLDIVLQDGDTLELLNIGSNVWLETARSVRDDSVVFDDVAINKVLNFPQAIQTIASGVVPYTQVATVLAAQSGTVDDFDGFTGGNPDDIAIIRADTGDTITLKHSATFDLKTQVDARLVTGDDILVMYCLSAGNWSEITRSLLDDFRSAGTTAGSHYLPNNILTQRGVAGGATVTFPISYDTIPVVVAIRDDLNGGMITSIGDETTTDFDANTKDFVGNAQTPVNSWIAIGIKAQ